MTAVRRTQLIQHVVRDVPVDEVLDDAPVEVALKPPGVRGVAIPPMTGAHEDGAVVCERQ